MQRPFSASAGPWASNYPTGERTKLDLARGEAAGLLDAYCVQGSERVNPEPASGQFRANVVLIRSGATGLVGLSLALLRENAAARGLWAKGGVRVARATVRWSLFRWPALSLSQ